MLRKNLYCDDVGSPVTVNIRAVDCFVLEPLNMRLKVAQQAAVKSHGATDHNGLIERGIEDDWRMRKSSCTSITINNGNSTDKVI